jgi:hypothetical protein
MKTMDNTSILMRGSSYSQIVIETSNETVVMQANGDGNVGVGLNRSNPQETLHVFGSSRIENLGDNDDVWV